LIRKLDVPSDSPHVGNVGDPSNDNGRE